MQYQEVSARTRARIFEPAAGLSNESRTWLHFLIELAFVASRTRVDILREGGDVTSPKGSRGTDISSIIDSTIQDVITKMWRLRYPTGSLVGEESKFGDDPTVVTLDGEYEIIIDPVDGTKNASNASGHFGPSISIRRRDNKNTVASIVMDFNRALNTYDFRVAADNVSWHFAMQANPFNTRGGVPPAAKPSTHNAAEKVAHIVIDQLRHDQEIIDRRIIHAAGGWNSCEVRVVAEQSAHLFGSPRNANLSQMIGNLEATRDQWAQNMIARFIDGMAGETNGPRVLGATAHAAAKTGFRGHPIGPEMIPTENGPDFFVAFGVRLWDIDAARHISEINGNKTRLFYLDDRDLSRVIDDDRDPHAQAFFLTAREECFDWALHRLIEALRPQLRFDLLQQLEPEGDGEIAAAVGSPIL